MSKKLLALCLVLAALACGGDAPSGPAAAALSLSADTVRPGAVLQVGLTGVRATRDTVIGALGGTQVLLGRVNDSSLVMLVPDVSPGAGTLEVTVDGRTLRAPLAVLAAQAIADPVATIDAALEAYRDSVVTAAPEGVSADQWTAVHGVLDSLIADAKARVAEIPAEDQLVLARLLASGGLPAVGGASALRAADVPTSPDALTLNTECSTATRRALQSGIQTFYAAYALHVWYVVPPVNPLVKGAGVAITTAAFVASLLNFETRFDAVRTSCFVQQDISLSGTGGQLLGAMAGSALRVSSTALPRLYVGVPAATYPMGGFRPLNAADVAADVVLSQLSEKVDAVLEIANTLLAKLPTAIVQRLPSLPVALSQLPTLPAVQQPLPPGEVRIANVSPSTITISATASGSALMLEATGNIATETAASFDIVSQADPDLRARVTVTVMPGIAGIYDAYRGVRDDGVAYSIPGVMEETADYRIEELGTVLTLNADSTWTLVYSNRFTDKLTGDVQPSSGTQSGTYSVTGGVLAMQTLMEDGQPDPDNERFTGEFTQAGITFTWSNGEQLSVRRR